MTEEQKSRMQYAEVGKCCEFDGLPMHPHYRYFLMCAGFKDLVEIESITEDEFVDIMNNAKTRSGKKLSHMQNLGKSMAKKLKQKGIVFAIKSNTAVESGMLE